MEKSSLLNSINSCLNSRNFESEESLIRVLASSYNVSERYMRDEIKSHQIVIDLTPRVVKRRGRPPGKTKTPKVDFSRIIGKIKQSVNPENQKMVEILEKCLDGKNVSADILELVRVSIPETHHTLLDIIAETVCPAKEDENQESIAA